jgi:hypothetical protein
VIAEEWKRRDGEERLASAAFRLAGNQHQALSSPHHKSSTATRQWRDAFITLREQRQTGACLAESWWTWDTQRLVVKGAAGRADRQRERARGTPLLLVDPISGQEELFRYGAI